MKLVLAIISHDDANTVTQSLTKAGFSSTKLATTGGFLMAGNVTILVGVDEEKVQTVIDIIREHSHSRRQMIPPVCRWRWWWAAPPFSWWTSNALSGCNGRLQVWSSRS